MNVLEKAIIITEKPSVARQFAAALGVSGSQDGYIENDRWVITWCVGHLVSLSYPEAYDPALKKWSMDTLPFLPETYHYEVLKKTAKQYKIVKELLNRRDISAIYNAGDSGREGEYIQRLVYRMAGVEGRKPIRRVWIDSQTDAEIKRGIRDAKPSSAYDALSDAAYERAIADFAVGINLSRALSCKYGAAFNRRLETSKYTPLAVGRVMTCVLGMVVGRERDIRDFKPEDFYKIDALHGDWTSHWKAVKGTRYFESGELYNESGLRKRETADALAAELQRDPKLTVMKLERKTEKQQAPALFNLAELQAECTKRFKITPSQTLDLAQSLYEKKLTTYPRTDARVLSAAVCKEIEKNILGLGRITGWQKETGTVVTNGWHRSIARNKKYVDDSKITDHYAIIPTGEGAKEYSRLSDLEKKVYELIARRFLAVFYPPAVYNKVNVELRHKSGEMFFAAERTLVEPGYRAIYTQPKKEDDEEDKPKEGLRSLREGETVKAAFKVVNTTTQPPKRYTSGSIILAMEGAGKLIDDAELREQIRGSGIGTSATRADIITKLEHDKYISMNKKTQIITPTSIGEALCDIVSETVPQMLSPKMTASWEKGLSQVERGEISASRYRAIMEDFVRKSVDRIKASASVSLPEKVEAVPIGKCPRCGRNVIEGRKGFGCIGYRDKENPCSFTIWKNNAILATGHKSISAAMAKKLLKGESITVSGLVSKAGKPYAAAFTLKDDGQNASLEMSFDQVKTRRSYKKSKTSK